MHVERDRNPIQRPRPTRPGSAGSARDRHPVPRPQPQRPGFPTAAAAATEEAKSRNPIPRPQPPRPYPGGDQASISAPESAPPEAGIPNISSLFK